VLFTLGLAITQADELKGVVKRVDKTAKTVTVTVDGKDTTLPVGKDASIVAVSNVAAKKGKKNKATEKLTTIDNGLEGVKAGANVTLLTDKVDEKETVTSIKVTDGAAAAKQQKKKKKNN
jgi:hypothetical protein